MKMVVGSIELLYVQHTKARLARQPSSFFLRHEKLLFIILFSFDVADQNENAVTTVGTTYLDRCRYVREVVVEMEADKGFWKLQTSKSKAARKRKPAMTGNKVIEYMGYMGTGTAVTVGTTTGFSESGVKVLYVLSNLIKNETWDELERYNGMALIDLQRIFKTATAQQAPEGNEAELLWGSPDVFSSFIKEKTLFSGVFNKDQTLEQQLDIVTFIGLSFVVYGARYIPLSLFHSFSSSLSLSLPVSLTFYLYLVLSLLFVPE